MADKIEMSLDDIIKSSRKPNVNSHGRTGKGARGAPTKGRGGGSPRKRSGLQRRGGGGIKGRAAGGVGIQKSKFLRDNVNSDWMHDGPKRTGMKSTIHNELSKLVVSNLEFGVSDADIRELFIELGPLKKASIHYDRSGRSLGSADVIFERRADAIKAMKQYNGVPLDGRAMKIQFATSDVAAISGVFGTRPSGVRAKRKHESNASNVKRGPDGVGGHPNRREGSKSGRRNPKAPTKSAEELDAELDAYVNEMTK